MRVISLLLSLCFTFNVMASTGTVQELEKAIDEYQFAMTVEWDQKDQSFVKKTTDAFYGNLSELMERGLTQEEVMNVISQKTKNPKDIEVLKLKLKSLAGNAHSSSDLAQAIAENSKLLYSNGASWDGSVIITGGVLVVVAALIGYGIWWDANHTCIATAQGQQCGWTSYYPGGPQFYQCWPTTYCTQYVAN
jgi:hypothetical protein